MIGEARGGWSRAPAGRERYNSGVTAHGRIAGWTALLLFLAAGVWLAFASRSAAGVAVPTLVRGTINIGMDAPTSLAFGPDGRLYVASQTEIRAFTLNPATKQVTASEQIASGLSEAIGIAFDPTAPPSPVVVYVSRREPSATDGFESRITTYTGPSWTAQDVITGLPTSFPYFNHYTNGLAFDGAGQLLIAQGSSSDAGVWSPSFWAETPLSSALLVADVNDPGFDGATTYSPSGSPTSDNIDQTGGDVSVYAAGLRNPYDVVVHSNGKIYATDNGKSGATVSTGCAASGANPSAADELNLIVQGDYYGHPNRNRGRTDARQCVYHAPEDGDGVDFTGPIAVLPNHCSCDGITEYTSDVFGGTMQGDLLIASWAQGELMRVQLSGDGESVTNVATLAEDLSGPLDVTVGPGGTIYIAEFSAGRITYLAPDTDLDGCANNREGGTNQNLGGQRDPGSFWDFFDVWTNTPAVRDRQVTGLDIFGVIARFNAEGNPNGDPLAGPPAPPAYHTSYDRGPLVGPYPWSSGPPDGAIAGGDIFAVISQFGHSCL